MYDAGKSGERIIIHEKSIMQNPRKYPAAPRSSYTSAKFMGGGGGGGGGLLVSNYPWKKSVWKYFPREDRSTTVHVCLQVR